MSGLVFPLRPAHGVDLLADYDDYVDTLMVNASCRWVRQHGARALLRHHPDLEAWMTRSTPARLSDLHRAEAWPFVVWCFVTGRLRPDAEILLAKPGGVELASPWQTAHPGEIEAIAEVGRRFAWSENWIRQVSRHSLPVVCLWAGKSLYELDDEDLASFTTAAERSTYLSASARYHARTRLHSIRRALYELRIVDTPARKGGPAALSAVAMAGLITQPAIARDVARYAEVIATTLRPATVASRVKAIRVFTDYLAEHHPALERLDQLTRAEHVEPFIIWDRSRARRGNNGGGHTISLRQFHHDLIDVRAFFEDIAAWEWSNQPARRLLFYSDLPRLPEPLPRALPPDIDRDLMAAVSTLEDPFTRTGLIVLRSTGMRVGELLDLELDCLVNVGVHGTWLKVPLGKLNTERMVPLDPEPLAALDAWMALRGGQRSLPHPRDGHLADFVFVQGGRRLTSWRLARGLDDAAATAGLHASDGKPLHVTIHQLRHTYGTSLVNAGISLPALMALMGHVTPEMTLRYAKLSSPTVRSAYETAMTKVRGRRPLLIPPASGTSVPSRIDWLRAEMLKTRVAHGYCSREPVAGPCPYANICEQCDNFTTTAEFTPALADQLDDLKALREDAEARGWESEAARHGRVVEHLETHLRRVERPAGRPSD
ncbi:MAG: tyrosine-type recombinase/integrase [Acidimicrobiales bacterium]